MGTHSVKVPRLGPPLFGAIRTSGNFLERVDILIEALGMFEVELVAIRMGIFSSGVASFSPASDGQCRELGGFLESDYAVDSSGTYTRVGCAFCVGSGAGE